MRIPTKLALLFIVAAPLAGLVGAGCSGDAKPPGGSAGKGGAGSGGKGAAGAGAAGTNAAGTGAAGTGDAGTGAAGTGGAGTGAAGTGGAGTGAAGTGGAGTGAAGTGGAGTGAAGTGGAGMTGTDAAAGSGAAGSSSTDGGADTSTTDGAADTSSADAAADTSSADVATDTSSTDVAAETGGSDAGIPCVTIPLPFPAAVFARYLTAEGPAPAGGTIVDGTYSLTELNHYDSATASTGTDPFRSAIKFAGNVIEWANKDDEEPPTGASYTYVKGTTTLALTNVCPTSGPGEAAGYTSTATTFKLYLDAEYVYTKQ